jgi:signal transduction histidine kinase
VLADRGWLAQALTALIDNALKFSPEDTPVEVSTHRRDDGVCIDVTDRGIGIPADEHERVFVPLYRGHEAEARRIPGAGLGLAIVAKLVALHGGRVEIDSAPGSGTRVHLWLAGAAPPA